MILGIICIFLSSIAFGISPVFVTEITANGMDTQSMLFFTKIFAVLGVGAAILIRKVSLRVTKTQLWQLILYCGCGEAMTVLLLCNSYRFLPIGIATMIHFIYPVLVTIIMIAFFKEKFTAKKVVAIIVAIAGLALILDLSGSMSLLGVTLAVGSGFSYALFVIANRKSAYSSLPTSVVVFYTELITFLGFSLYHAVTERLVVPNTGWEWFMISFNGLFSSAFAFFMLICAIRRIGPSNAAIANMLEPLTALIAGAVIYGDRIGFVALCGCILVLVAVTIVALDSKNHHISENEVEALR